MTTVVNKEDIIKACKELGIKSNDTIIIHSSLKSFGYVEGGAATVIDAFKEVLKDGTLCFPALRQKEFYNAYRDWDINKTPSDVGYLSEFFRTSEGVLRSDQETHSITAFGVNADFITSGHRGGKKRIGLFGDYAFSPTSPWQRIYDLKGKVVFIGVGMRFNTLKHLVEYMVVNDILDDIKDGNVREQAISELSKFNGKAPDPNIKPDPNRKPNGVWFWYDGVKMHEFFVRKGLVKSTVCGESTILCVNAKDFVDEWYKQLRYNPDEWMLEKYSGWVKKYDKGELK